MLLLIRCMVLAGKRSLCRRSRMLWRPDKLPECMPFQPGKIARISAASRGSVDSGAQY